MFESNEKRKWAINKIEELDSILLDVDGIDEHTYGQLTYLLAVMRRELRKEIKESEKTNEG